MCQNGNECICTQTPKFDKTVLREAINQMSTSLDRVAELEKALKDAVYVISQTKTAIGTSCYMGGYSPTAPTTWHKYIDAVVEKFNKILVK